MKITKNKPKVNEISVCNKDMSLCSPHCTEYSLLKESQTIFCDGFNKLLKLDEIKISHTSFLVTIKRCAECIDYFKDEEKKCAKALSKAATKKNGTNNEDN
jgi:hypothetical protein